MSVPRVHPVHAVADTHAVIWYLYDDPRLSTAARDAFTQAASAGRLVAISPLTIVEMIYLVERNRIPREALDRLMEELDFRRSVLGVFSLNQHIAQTVASIRRATVPEMPDRVIAATALALGVPLLTRDARIRASGVLTIW